MNHLTDEQLSRRLDGALEGRALAEVESHLAGCGACRDALAALAAGDAALKPALSHDPGDAYFEDFAARVEDRLRAAGLSGAQARERATGWASPRRLTLVGAVAAVVAGAALTLMTSRDFRPTSMRDRDLTSRIEESAPPPAAVPAPAPPAEQEARRMDASTRDNFNAREKKVEASGPKDGTLQKQRAAEGAAQGAPVPVGKEDDDRALASAPDQARSRQVVRDERGEDVVVGGSSAALARPPATAQPPEPTATSQAAGKRVARPGAPQPMTGATEEQAKTSKLLADRTETFMGQTFNFAQGETPLCGEVVDGSGRAVAGAQVVLAKLGRVASTNAAGRFCLGAPAGDHEVLVMAVGFRDTRQQVRVAGESAEVRLTLNAVDVLGARTQGVPSGLDPFAALDDTTRARVTEARALTAVAATRGTASSHDAAAAAWTRALGGIASGPALEEARHALAAERYRAWQRTATTARRDAAIEAIVAWLAVAPAGPRKDEAAGWMERLGR